MFGDAPKEGADPGNGKGRGVDEGEEGLALQEGNEFPQLRPGELKKEDGGGGDAKALEGSEGRKNFSGRRMAQVDLDFEGNGIAGSGGGEIGGEVEPKHGQELVAEDAEETQRSSSWIKGRRGKERPLKHGTTVERRIWTRRGGRGHGAN